MMFVTLNMKLLYETDLNIPLRGLPYVRQPS